MFLEHITFTLAIALLISVFYPQIRGAYLMLFTLSGVLPDVDAVIDLAHLSSIPLTYSNMDMLSMAWEHTRMFHNIPMLIMFAMIGGMVMERRHDLDMKFSAYMIGAGFAAHLFEDWLVYKPAEAILWPISSKEVGVALLPSTSDFFGVANTEVLVISLILIVIALSFGKGMTHARQVSEKTYTANYTGDKQPIPAAWFYLP